MQSRTFVWSECYHSAFHFAGGTPKLPHLETKKDSSVLFYDMQTLTLMLHLHYTVIYAEFYK